MDATLTCRAVAMRTTTVYLNRQKMKAKNDDESVSDEESSKTKCRNCRKLSATVKRLQKLLTSKTAFITRLKNQKGELLAHHTARFLSQKGINANLKMQLTNERYSRNQIKSVLRTEYLTEIKAAKELERASGKRAQLADRATNRLRGEYEYEPQTNYLLFLF
jgi:hypothetical protein